MAICNGCGQCCNPVMLPYTHIRAITDQRIPEEGRRWARDALVPMTHREAFARQPWMRGRVLRDQFGQFLIYPNFFRCLRYDAEAKRCSDYDNRPSTCRGYPWYGEAPRPDAALPPDCSYKEDLIQIGRKP